MSGKATEENLKGRLVANLSEEDNYSLIHDAYYGTGLFSHGYGLIQHPRESIENYINRKKLAYYWNYTGPIVNAMVDPIFKDDIKREYRSSELFKAFLDDCDRAGMTYQDFCKSAALIAKLYGAAYIVVDNASDMDSSLSDAITNRHLPFLKIVAPYQIKDWEIDDYGRIISFTYEERIRNGAYSEMVHTCTWTDSEWAISDGNGVKETGTHNLGHVPVVQWLARNTDKKIIKPPSEYISVAQTNFFLFQLCSWHTQILRDQAFSILTIPDSGGDEITVGTNNVLAYPPESSHTPAFISPAAAPADMLTGQMDRCVKEMFRMSGLESVLGASNSDNKSGVSKEWDFEKTNKRIADFAVRCENADEAIIGLYEAWSGDNVGYSCEYPRDFKINDVSDSLADAQAALDLGFDSISYKQEVLKKVLAAYLPNLKDEVYDNILKEMKAAAELAMQDAVYGANDGTEGDKQRDKGVPEGNQSPDGKGDEPKAGGGEGL